MSQKEITGTLITSLSGVIGGTAAMTANASTLMNPAHLIEIAFCATCSAVIGYVVKLGADQIRHRIIRCKQQRIHKKSTQAPKQNQDEKPD